LQKAVEVLTSGVEVLWRGIMDDVRVVLDDAVLLVKGGKLELLDGSGRRAVFRVDDSGIVPEQLRTGDLVWARRNLLRALVMLDAAGFISLTVGDKGLTKVVNELRRELGVVV